MKKTKRELNNRICVITKNSYPKSELIRFGFVGNELVVDKQHKIKSRGFYIHNSLDVLNKIDSKLLLKEASKALKKKASIDKAIEEITKWQNK